MTVTREVVLDAVEVRPLMKQVGVTKCIKTYEDDQLVSVDYMTRHFSDGDDLSEEEELVQQIARNFWDTL